MNESIPAASLEGVAAYIGIDWADQKHDVVLRSAAEPNKVEHRVIEHQPGALMEWIGQLQQRFGGHGQILVCLEQSRGALIHHLMGYGFLELYPVNPLQLARYRETFSPGGAKDDQPDAERSLRAALLSSRSAQSLESRFRTNPQTGLLQRGAS
jgi:hypothetical protein